MFRHLLAISGGALFILFLLGTSPPKPKPIPSTNYPTNLLYATFNVELDGTKSTFWSRLSTSRTQEYITFSGDDKIVISSGSFAPLEYTGPGLILAGYLGQAERVPFNYTAGDSIQISLLRASRDYPDLLDAPDSWVTPDATAITMLEEPAAGPTARDAILTFSWLADGFDGLTLRQSWTCMSDGNTVTQSIESGFFEDNSIKLNVASQLDYVSSRYGFVDCSSYSVKILYMKNYGQAGLDTRFAGGSFLIWKVKSYEFTLVP